MSEDTQGFGQQIEPDKEQLSAEVDIQMISEQSQTDSEIGQYPEQDGREREQADEIIYSTPDVYQSQASQDIYQTTSTEVETYYSGGRFSGKQIEYSGSDSSQFGQSTYGSNPYGNSGTVNQPNSYGNHTYNNQYPYENSGNNMGSYPYGNNVNQTGPHLYGNNGNNANPYPYGNNTGSDPYGSNGNPAGSYPYGNNTGSNSYGNNGSTMGPNSYGNSGTNAGSYSYGNNGNPAGPYPYGSNGNSSGPNPYGNPNGGYGNGGQYPYGNPYGPGPYGYNNQPYSPYAVPQKKKNTGLIIGIIITVVVLFLIALFALLYHTFETISQRRSKEYQERYYDDYGYQDDDYYFDDDYDDYYYYGDDDYYDDVYGDYDYNYDYDYDSDQYYSFHNDIKNNLSYSVELETYEYDADNENVAITVDYPVVIGKNIPNLDKINQAIEDEVMSFTKFYEEEYSDYMYDESSFFAAYAAGYVTYMDEDVLSIAFLEEIYADYYSDVYLYSMNIDVKDGVILENVNIINVDDDFSVDFRLRSDEQNGSISALDMMSDQEITQYLTSEGSLIIFYTPQGLEVGLNYSDGWVTVTYQDYKNFLKIF